MCKRWKEIDLNELKIGRPSLCVECIKRGSVLHPHVQIRGGKKKKNSRGNSFFGNNKRINPDLFLWTLAGEELSSSSVWWKTLFIKPGDVFRFSGISPDVRLLTGGPEKLFKLCRWNSWAQFEARIRGFLRRFFCRVYVLFFLLFLSISANELHASHVTDLLDNVPSLVNKPHRLNERFLRVECGLAVGCGRTASQNRTCN